MNSSGVTAERGDALCGERRDTFKYLAQAARLGLGRAEEVGEPAAGLALDVGQAVPERDERLRVVAGGGHRVDADAVGLVLLSLLLAVAALPGARLARGVVENLVVLLEDVAAVADTRHAQHLAEEARHLGGELTRGGVPQLVREHAGQLVLARGERDELARDVDAPARHREGVGVRQVNDEELVAHLGRRELLDQTLADAPEEARRLGVFDDAVVLLDVLGDNVAQVHLLSRREDALRAGGGRDDGLLAGLLLRV